MSWLTQPWEHPFMQNAFLAAMLVGLICGVIGVFVVLKGLAFMGDALSHAIFPGIVIAYLFGANYLIGAMIAAIIVSILIGLTSSHTRVNNDTAIGVFFVGAFALGIALISTQRTYTRDLTSFLVGSILGVSRDDLYLTAAVGAVVLLVVAIDPPGADIDRVRSGLFPGRRHQCAASTSSSSSSCFRWRS